MVIPNGEIMKNLVIYPSTEPNPLIKPGFTLAQNFPPSDEPKLGNEYIRPILMISEALCFKDETEDYSISTFISSPNPLSGSTRRLLESVMSCTTQETIEPKTKIKNIPITAPHNNIHVEIDQGKTFNVNPNFSPS